MISLALYLAMLASANIAVLLYFLSPVFTSFPFHCIKLNHVPSILRVPSSAISFLSML